MKTATFSNRPLIVSGACAVLAMAAMAFSGNASARDDVSFSVGIGLPGVSIGASNAYPVYGGYPQPVYVQPAPVYVQPAPVYVQPRPVYRAQPIYVQPAPVYVQPGPVYYGRPGWSGYRNEGYGRGYHRDHDRGHNRGYDRDGRGDDHGHRSFQSVPAPVYYQR
jgi:PXPV repeat (3 copies)